MYKGSDLKGKPIISIEDGKIIDSVSDIINNPKSGKVLGLLLEGGLFERSRVIPFKSIRSIGPDAVMIENENAVTKASDDKDIQSYMNDKVDVVGKTVMTESGEDLGKIADIIIDEKTGSIKNYEVSGGIFADLYSGKSYLPPFKIVNVGEDVIIVPDSVVQDFEQQEQGLKKMAEEFRKKAKQTVQGTKEKSGIYAHEAQARFRGNKVEETAKGWWTGITNAASDWSQRTRKEIEQQRIDGALGRPVTRVIYDNNDDIVLNTGDLITHEAIDKAREEGVLDILLNSVYVGKPEFNKDELKAKDQKEN